MSWVKLVIKFVRCYPTFFSPSPPTLHQHTIGRRGWPMGRCSSPRMQASCTAVQPPAMGASAHEQIDARPPSHRIEFARIFSGGEGNPSCSDNGDIKCSLSGNAALSGRRARWGKRLEREISLDSKGEREKGAGTSMRAFGERRVGGNDLGEVSEVLRGEKIFKKD